MIIEPIINSHKIKYKLLKKMVDANITSGERVNIYINLDSIFDSFYVPNVVEGIRDMKYYEGMALSSEIINMVAHYRHFFWTYYKVPSTFYLYFLNKTPRNDKLIPGYASNKIDRKKANNDRYHTLNQFILDNMKLINIISVYVQQCYCLASDGLEPALIPYHLIKENKNKDVVHLILTKDKFDYQLLNATKSSFILNLKYDDSYMIKADNIYDHKLKDIKYKPSIEFSPKLYSLILALSGVKSRNVKSMQGLGFVSAMKKLEKAIKDGDVANKYNSNMLEVAEALNILEDYDELNTRFKAVDLKYNHSALSTADIELINLKLLDRFDNNSIMYINEKYYSNNPIRLIELCEGVSY